MPELQLKIFIAIVLLEFVLHFVAWGLTDTGTATMSAPSPSITTGLGAILGSITFANIGIPFPFDLLLISVNAICLFAISILVIIDVIDLLPYWT